MGLFEVTNGSVVKGYLLLRKEEKNVSPSWIERYRDSRKSREKDIVKILKRQNLLGIVNLEDWESFYQKECFYNGIRLLFELERKGKTKR